MQRGFTLVELAIVLTIIGLIIGGVIVGSDMIRSAELNSLWTDKQRYVSAINAFRDKYQYQPGDMPNATQFWGSAGGTGSDATCGSTASTGTTTCNGNGNGQIEIPNSAGVYELLTMWTQLADAGLIQGQYIGVTGQNAGYTRAYVNGVNCPATKLSGICLLGRYFGYQAGSTNYFQGMWGNFFQPQNAIVNGITFRPSDVYQIDSKFDDGLPASGFIVSWKGSVAQPCTTKAGQPVGSDRAQFTIWPTSTWIVLSNSSISGERHAL